MLNVDNSIRFSLVYTQLMWRTIFSNSLIIIRL